MNKTKQFLKLLLVVSLLSLFFGLLAATSIYPTVAIINHFGVESAVGHTVAIFYWLMHLWISSVVIPKLVVVTFKPLTTE